MGLIMKIFDQNIITAVLVCVLLFASGCGAPKTGGVPVDDHSSTGSGYTGGSTPASEEESNDTEGGIASVENTAGAERFFMGTYEASYFSCDYALPSVVRLYSHDNAIDFEDSTGKIVWVAEVYSDETFDLDIQFLNKFGHPSVTLSCTCEIIEYQYTSDEMSCTCDPSDPAAYCSNLYYDKMEN